MEEFRKLKGESIPPPQSLGQLGILLTRQLPNTLIRQMPIILLVLIFACLINVLWVAFFPSEITSILVYLVQNTVFWAVISGILISLAIRLRREGITSILQGYRGLAGYLAGAFQQAGNMRFPAILFGAILAIFFSILTGGLGNMLLLAWVTADAIAAKNRSIFYYAIPLAYQDFQRSFGAEKTPKQMSPAYLPLGLAGAALGFLFSIPASYISVYGRYAVPVTLFVLTLGLLFIWIRIRQPVLRTAQYAELGGEGILTLDKHELIEVPIPNIEAVLSVVCAQCQALLAPGKKFCTQCGAPLQTPTSKQQIENAEAEAMSEMVCPNCGSEMVPGKKFCTQCGARLFEAKTMKQL